MGSWLICLDLRGAFRATVQALQTLDLGVATCHQTRRLLCSNGAVRLLLLLFAGSHWIGSDGIVLYLFGSSCICAACFEPRFKHILAPSLELALSNKGGALR